MTPCLLSNEPWGETVRIRVTIVSLLVRRRCSQGRWNDDEEGRMFYVTSCLLSNELWAETVE